MEVIVRTGEEAGTPLWSEVGSEILAIVLRQVQLEFSESHSVEVEVAFQGGPVDTFPLLAGCRGGFVVEPVLDRSEKLEIFDRHEGRNALATSIQHDAFTTLGDTVEAWSRTCPVPSVQ